MCHLANSCQSGVEWLSEERVFKGAEEWDDADVALRDGDGVVSHSQSSDGKHTCIKIKQ